MRVCFSSSVYRKKCLQQINFSNKSAPFSVQSVHGLVLELKIVTADTRKLRAKVPFHSSCSPLAHCQTFFFNTHVLFGIDSNDNFFFFYPVRLFLIYTFCLVSIQAINVCPQCQTFFHTHVLFGVDSNDKWFWGFFLCCQTIFCLIHTFCLASIQMINFSSTLPDFFCLIHTFLFGVNSNDQCFSTLPDFFFIHTLCFVSIQIFFFFFFFFTTKARITLKPTVLIGD